MESQIQGQATDQTADKDINQVKTKRNKTMLEQIRGKNRSPYPETSYGRSMVQ